MRPILLLIVLAGCPSDWRRRDSLLEGAVMTSLSLDWGQTQGITGRCLEYNPIIGACGQGARLDVYFIVTALLEVAAARLLPPDLRTAFQSFLLGSESATVGGNALSGFPL